VNDRHLLFKPGEWAGAMVGGYRRHGIYCAGKDQADATAFALMKGSSRPSCLSRDVHFISGLMRRSSSPNATVPQSVLPSRRIRQKRLAYKRYGFVSCSISTAS